MSKLSGKILFSVRLTLIPKPPDTSNSNSQPCRAGIVPLIAVHSCSLLAFLSNGQMVMFMNMIFYHCTVVINSYHKKQLQIPSYSLRDRQDTHLSELHPHRDLQGTQPMRPSSHVWNPVPCCRWKLVWSYVRLEVPSQFGQYWWCPRLF